MSDLTELQKLPLEDKVTLTQDRILQWYHHFGGKVYVSFSGGKDSTVLLHLARQVLPEIPAVFCDTGLEFPEIKEFVKTVENVETIRPKLTFRQVLDKYGYPVVSKEQACYIDQYRNTKSEYLRQVRWEGKKGHTQARYGMISKKWRFLVDAPFKISDRCCYALKKAPLKSYESRTKNKPILGTMAHESNIRRIMYERNGCNAFDMKRPVSQPLSFWFDKDIWEYLKIANVPYSKIYDAGYERTGCIFCMFGVQREEKGNTRFDKLRSTHPKIYDYCMNKLGIREVLNFVLKENK